MSKIFVKKDELSLVNGGYLVKGETPVNHHHFVCLQEEAHYLVNLADKVKGVDFSVKEVKSFQSYVNDVQKQLADEKRTYVNAPDIKGTPIADSLKDEAMAWLQSKDQGTKAEKINNMLQKFNLLGEFQDFGLYFDDDKIVKLKGLYTIDQIVDALTVLEPHLEA